MNYKGNPHQALTTSASLKPTKTQNGQRGVGADTFSLICGVGAAMQHLRDFFVFSPVR